MRGQVYLLWEMYKNDDRMEEAVCWPVCSWNLELGTLPVFDRAEILAKLLRDGDGSLDVLGVERHAFATSQRQSLMQEEKKLAVTLSTFAGKRNQ